MLTFKEVSKFFKENLKLTHPLSIRRVKMVKLDGSCEIQKDKFLIRIKNSLSESHAIDILIHEIAHAIAWKKEPDMHGPEWGKAYSIAYKLFENQFLN